MRAGVWVALGAAIAVAMSVGGWAKSAAQADRDPYLWLSDIHGAKALAWVKGQNAKSNAVLKRDPEYKRDYDAILKSLDTHDRIPAIQVVNGEVFNFWQDERHVRGIWRKTGADDFRKREPDWEILLDVDKLDADTHADWVFHGANCSPSGNRCLITLSPGGGDASVIREYDPKTHSFVDGGFSLALAKSNADYVDDDTIAFATDFGPGSLTTSGYARIVKLWHRGQDLSAAKTIFEGEKADVSVVPVVYHTPAGMTAGKATVIVTRGLTFFQTEYDLVLPDGSVAKLPLPQGANVHGITQGNLVFTLRDDWTVNGTIYKQGSLLAFALAPFVASRALPALSVLYVPDERSTVSNVATGKDGVYAAIFTNVVGSIHVFRAGGSGAWSDVKLDVPPNGTTAMMSADGWGSQAYFTYESFLIPPTLFEDKGDGKPVAVKSQAPLFDANTYVADQFEVASADGTKIPYFLIHAKNSHGPLPTILYSYGGFELTLFPWYWNDGHRPLDAGQVWLNKGGAIAVANIRGGGEFGPRWHQAAMKYHHQHAFDDFEAVAMDLLKRRVTTPGHLGIVGASNGGLLVTATMTQKPNLFSAVICQRPLIDMLRYTHFGAGASWVDEYGDPADPKMRKYILTYSPYQKVAKGVKYPAILFITETSDDRVTPIFARMMAAKMEAQSHQVLFNESAEGGHGAGATNAQQAEYWALSYTYFKQKLGLLR
ncbi:MAG: S9 family peptidase [Proteobacteria bacterium]|nr:S9 family peptidase [Pseudomonadota bacterium]